MRKGQELCDGFSTKVKLLCHEFLVPKKENLNGNQVRLMKLWYSDRFPLRVLVLFPGFPGRFVPLLASPVSLWMLLRIRGFLYLNL